MCLTFCFFKPKLVTKAQDLHTSVLVQQDAHVPNPGHEHVNPAEDAACSDVPRLLLRAVLFVQLLVAPRVRPSFKTRRVLRLTPISASIIIPICVAPRQNGDAVPVSCFSF